MSVNFISVVLGGAGLLVGTIGLVAQDIREADRRSTSGDGDVAAPAAAWPPHPPAVAVEFHDQIAALISLGPQPRRGAELHDARAPQQRAQALPDSSTSIRHIRLVRLPGRRGAEVVDIEFVDPDGDTHRRAFPVERHGGAAGDEADEFAPDQSRMETYGYSPRRSRRYGRSQYRRSRR